MYFDLTLNLSLVIALSAVSGFISQRLQDGRTTRAVLQGVLFGLVAVIGMNRPVVIEPGLIFDGRSVMLSVCALYFGPWAAVVSGALALAGRAWIGGVGLIPGLLTIGVSVVGGLYFRRRFHVPNDSPSAKQLFGMGVAVHLGYISFMLGLPRESALHAFEQIALPMMVLFPLATILAGKIIGNQERLNRSIQALQRTNELQSITLRSVGDGVIAIDREGRITKMNPSAAALTGWESRDAIGALLSEVVRITPGLAIQSAMEGVCSDLPPDSEISSREGTKCALGGSIAPMKDDRDQVVGVVVTLRNRTKEIESERALRASETKYRSVVEHSPDVIVRCDNEHRIIFANTQAEALLGWKVELNQPRTLRELDTPIEECAQWEAACKRMAETGLPHELEVLHQGSRGEIILLARLVPEPHQAGSTLVIIQDVTERRRSERRMRLLTSALNAAANAIVITDKHAIIEWVNPAFSRFTGFAFDEAIGADPGAILGSGKHPKSLYKTMWATIAAGKVWSGEMINRRKDGTFYTEDMTITPIVDHLGEITHYVAVKQDITQRKSLEAQARHSQKMDAIGQLAGGVAHDFNNILASVLLNVGLLQMELDLDTTKTKRLSELEKEIMKGAALARQLLAFSRKQSMEVRPLDLHASIAGLLRMLNRLVGETVKIELMPSDKRPKIQADLGMIEQVVVNLVVNARDAMPKGGTVVIDVQVLEVTTEHVETTAEARVGQFVRLSVLDTGHGMDELVLEKIFEPFFTTKEAGKGTGLGLATVHGIVKQHGGWIEVESVVGSGTRFDIFFESCDAAVATETPPAAPGHQTGAGETILLAEDDPSVQRAIAESLRQSGYRVITAKNGPEAVAVWNDSQTLIKLLITDMIMPEKMNGMELASKLRETRPDLKVIICTGYGAELLPTQLPANPPTVVLRKPFQPATLMSTVRQILDC